MEVLKIDWLEVGEVVEYFSQNKVCELLVFVFLRHEDFVVEIGDIYYVAHHVLKVRLEPLEPPWVLLLLSQVIYVAVVDSHVAV